jgi:hypothetical protein
MDTVSPVVPTRAAVDSFIQGEGRGRRAGRDALDAGSLLEWEKVTNRKMRANTRTQEPPAPDELNIVA